MKLRVLPVVLKEANALVASWHRHHTPVQGARFSLGVADEDGVLHGACIVGRPVARMAGSPRAVAEVTRLVTDGSPNACSMLYAAAARACQAMGFERIQTYILDDEPGTSLRASGWEYEGSTRPRGSWSTPSRPERNREIPKTAKGRWSKRLNPSQPEVRPPTTTGDHPMIWPDAA